MRLATFNILHGRSPKDGLVDLGRFADAVAAVDADVLALQEVDRSQPRSHGADLAAVAADAMRALDHRFVAALSGVPGSGSDGGAWGPATGREPPHSPGYGIALLSRYPVRSWRELRLKPLPVRVPLMRGGRAPVLVQDESRVAVAAVLATPYGEVTVAATHLSFLPGWNVRQLRQVRRALAAGPGPVVLMGDLNMGLRPAVPITRMRPLATGRTFPAHAPRRQLDHILASGELPPVLTQAVHVLPVSDHRAISVDLGVLRR